MDKFKKDDENKLRWSLIPLRELQEVAEVLELGAQKYGVNNWMLMPTGGQRYVDATLRHFNAWQLGERADQEDGKSHLAHAICNIMFIMWAENQSRNPYDSAIKSKSDSQQ